MPVTEADKDVLNLSSLAGARVSQVEPGLPAAKAGLELGDVIVKVDDHVIQDAGQLTALLAEKYRPGQAVNLGIVRYGKSMNIKVELATFEPAVKTAREPVRRPERGVSVLGFQATELTPQIARQLNVQAEDGVVITDIDPAGSARGFVAPGMVIEQINGKQVRTLEDLDREARQVDDGDAVSLIVRTPDGRRTMVNYRIRS
jgi:serine protease Do